MKTAYIIDAVRTPMGKYGGKLSAVRPDDMLAVVIKALVERNAAIDTNLIEDVIAGAANQAGEDNRNVARMAALLAGLPVTVAGNTVNRLCGSGMQAVMDAARAIQCGEGMLYIAGGVESMTRAPFVLAKNNAAFSCSQQLVDSTIGWRFINEKIEHFCKPLSMGETAEIVAKQWGISREAQDAFALQSHEKYFAALAAGKWKNEIVPVNIAEQQKPVWFDADEPPRHTTIEKLARLKPAFVKNGTVTVGNASGINDGAAAILLASEEAVKRFNLKPMARIAAMSVAGVHPDVMGIGPVPATNKILQRAGIAMSAIGLIELNEAFAAQSIACMQALNIDDNIVNVNGGAIALGNPLGSAGARIINTLLHEMNRIPSVKYGLATTCVGVGQGTAILFEQL